MNTLSKNRIAPTGVFYRSNGKWTPFRTVTGKVRTFTSIRELNRFLKNYEFKCEKNYVLKSKIAVRKVSA